MRIKNVVIKNGKNKMAINEEEEFEFRVRLEREQAGLPWPPEQAITTKKFSSEYNVPPFIQKIAQKITTPIRGFRGIGVGTQRLLQGISPNFMIPGGTPSIYDVGKMARNAPIALQRAAIATEPGYQAIPGERIGATLGEAAGYAGLTAPLAAIAPANIPIQSAIGATTGGALSAIGDISEEGKFYPGRTITNAAIGGLLPILASKNVKNVAAKTAGALGRIQSGVEQRFGERLYKSPGAFYSPSEKAAGEKLGAFRAGKGLKKIVQTAKEIVSPEAAEARKYIVDIEKQYALSKLGRAEPPTPSQLLKAKQSINKIIEVTPFKQRETRADLFELKNSISDVLEKSVPGEKSASAKYAMSALGAKFRKLLPVTKSGDISLTRTIGLPIMEPGTLKDLGILGAAPLVAAQSPFLAGAAISTAGGIHKGIESVIKSPVGRQVTQSLLQQVTKTLSTDKAKEYYREIRKENPDWSDKEIKNEIRKRSNKDGYTITKR